MKRLSINFLSLALVLSACGQRATPTETTQVAPPTTSESAALLQQGASTIDNRGGELKFGHTRLIIPEGAVPQSTEFLVKTLPAPQYPLTLPPVNRVYGSYLIGEVPGREVSQVLRVSTSAAMIPKGAGLYIKAIGRKGGKDATDIIFGVPEGSSEVTYLGAYKNADEYYVRNVLGGIYAQAKNVTLYVVRADSSLFEEKCRSLGGVLDTNCNLSNNELSNNLLNAQAAYKTMNILTWNVGNVADSCRPYNVKLCYDQTRDNVAKKITDLETANGKFGIIFLQELWPGDCTGINDTDPARLCGSPEEKAVVEHSIVRILGAYGSRYRYQCADRANGGYECIAVDPALFEVAAGTKGYITGNCDSKNDTGHFTHQFKFTPTQTYVSLVSTHMTGIPNASCRAAQLQKLSDTYLYSNKQLLIAGDFNTTRGETTIAGQTFNGMFEPYGVFNVYNSSKLAYELSNKSTADYLGASVPLDHVLSNFMYFPSGVTDCPVGDLGFFGGTDHKYTTCRLTGLFGGGLKTQ